MSRYDQLPKEELIHFVWKTKRVPLTDLVTTDGDTLQILNFGFHNRDAGPDFGNGKIQLGDTTWIGHIEMHVKSSDWNRHGHTDDPAYDNVILHVVYHHDKEIYRKDGSMIPTLQIGDKIDHTLLEMYEELQKQSLWIPCQSILSKMDMPLLSIWLDRLSIERIERKVEEYRALLLKQSHDWDNTFHIATLQRLGMRVNKEGFMNIGLHIPLQILLKYSDSIFSLEALLFGIAGYLAKTDESNAYLNELKQTYDFLAHKHQLSPIDNTQIKNGRLRPQNLPTVRLAQYARLIYHHGRLFSKLLECQSLEEIEDIFAIKIKEGYWYEHYTFTKVSSPIEKAIGKVTIHSLVINLICPMLYLKGKMTDDQKLLLLSQTLMESIRPESNSIIDQWKSIGIRPDNAKESQALLQLKNEYCDHTRCLECTIGYKILSQKD